VDPYGSHIKILEFVVDKFNIKTVLETGLGKFSTSLFINKCDEVISLEMQDSKWYDIISNKFNGSINFHPNLLLGPFSACKFIKNIDKKFDLIFVDGHWESRWMQINVSFSKTDLIIAHDSEVKSYNWHKVIFPDNFVWIDVMNYIPWTAVICKKDSIYYDEILKNFNTKLKKRFNLIKIEKKFNLL